MFDLGATVRLTAECRDPGGVLTTAATATLTITLPDRTTATPAVTTSGTGQYQADYVTTVPGRHAVRWSWTVPAAAYTDVFDVQEEAPPAILSLADACEHVNASAREADELRFWNSATTRAVEYFTGPIVAREVAEVVDGGGDVQAVVLRHTPVLEVLAVDQLGSCGRAYDIEALTLDAATGVLARYDRGWLRRPLRVRYVAGRTIVGENILGAARIILGHLWDTQRAGRGGALAGGSQDYAVSQPIPGLGYAVPNRALELLGPDRLPPESG